MLRNGWTSYSQVLASQGSEDRGGVTNTVVGIVRVFPAFVFVRLSADKKRLADLIFVSKSRWSLSCSTLKTLFVFEFLWPKEMAEGGDPKKGEKIFKQRCSQCHTTEFVWIFIVAQAWDPGILSWRECCVHAGRKTQDWAKPQWSLWSKNWTSTWLWLHSSQH